MFARFMYPATVPGKQMAPSLLRINCQKNQRGRLKLWRH